MSQKKSRFVLALFASILGSAFVAGAAAMQDPESAILKVTDHEALEAAKGTDVVVEGTCSAAAWSNSGKVMNIQFEGTDQFAAVIFQRNQKKIDEAFSGDAAKSFTGARLRIKGQLREYAGQAQSMKGRLEITITEGSQVTIVEPAQPG